MKKLAIIYFFAFWLFSILDDIGYWMTHGQARIEPSVQFAIVFIIMWLGGTYLIWNNKSNS